jgi:hypothetical protein
MTPQRDLVELRQNFRSYLLQNPNYFGNLAPAAEKAAVPQPVITLAGNTQFEELTCVSFNPETNELRAVVKVKQSSGYSGGPCTDGSKEYVRFYVDYLRDGTWVDEGAVNFDAHDLPFSEELCYAVRLEIRPKRRSCCDARPVLPRVRAILSWNQEPPPNQPGWTPVWGNRRDANIQIAPRSPFLCLILKNKLKAAGIEIDPDKLGALAEAMNLSEQPVELQHADLRLLRQQYGEQVEETRLGFSAVQAMAQQPGGTAVFEQLSALQKLGLNIGNILDFIQHPNFNTGYEELKCVGLNRDLSVLHGAVHIKRSFGYGGDLCHRGSREYIAFYMDFGGGWQYMGTTSVGVHDIPQPNGGLWYNAALPVSLTQHQQEWCRTGKARVRAILSWNAPPPPNQPNYVAPWGDWEECWVEIRPLPEGVQPGAVTPVIDLVGSMPVSLINASGYANGTNAVGLTAVDSPFDGKILVQGIMTNAPNSTAPGVSRLRYRLLVKAPSYSAHQPVLTGFTMWIREFIGGVLQPLTPVTQTPDGGGWLEYYPDFVGPDLVWVPDNLLGVFNPGEEGLHDLYIEMFDPNTSLTAVSNHVKVMVDKTGVVVDIEITSGAGNCGTFVQGDTISGTFTIADAHCYTMSLSVTPTAEAAGATPLTTSAPTGYATLTYGAILGALPGTGLSGTWELDTSGMEPCGYNVRIQGVERTIINSHSISRQAWDIEGFCLRG